MPSCAIECLVVNAEVLIVSDEGILIAITVFKQKIQYLTEGFNGAITYNPVVWCNSLDQGLTSLPWELKSKEEVFEDLVIGKTLDEEIKRHGDFLMQG